MTKEKLISASEMSRITNRPLSRLLKAVKAGAIEADATVMDGRLFLFAESRLDEVREKLSA